MIFDLRCCVRVRGAASPPSAAAASAEVEFSQTFAAGLRADGGVAGGLPIFFPAPDFCTCACANFKTCCRISRSAASRGPRSTSISSAAAEARRRRVTSAEAPALARASSAASAASSRSRRSFSLFLCSRLRFLCASNSSNERCLNAFFFVDPADHASRSAASASAAAAAERAAAAPARDVAAASAASAALAARAPPSAAAALRQAPGGRDHPVHGLLFLATATSSGGASEGNASPSGCVRASEVRASEVRVKRASSAASPARAAAFFAVRGARPLARALSASRRTSGLGWVAKRFQHDTRGARGADRA